MDPTYLNTEALLCAIEGCEQQWNDAAKQFFDGKIENPEVVIAHLKHQVRFLKRYRSRLDILIRRCREGVVVLRRI